MRMNLKQARELVSLFAENEETVMEVQVARNKEEGHEGAGIYAGYSEYPEEGSYFLGPQPV